VAAVTEWQGRPPGAAATRSRPAPTDTPGGAIPTQPGRRDPGAQLVAGPARCRYRPG
jgi:hypothetical protein